MRPPPALGLIAVAKVKVQAIARDNLGREEGLHEIAGLGRELLLSPSDPAMLGPLVAGVDRPHECLPIVVAHDEDTAESGEQRDGLLGLRSADHCVSKEDDFVPDLLGVQHGLEGGEVGVDVGYDERLHCRRPCRGSVSPAQ